MSKDPAENLYTMRHAQLAVAIQTSGLDVLALNPGKSLTYLTGLHFHLSERPVLALFVPHTPPIVVLPELEALKIESLDYPVQAFPYGEDPDTWGAVFHQAAQAAKVDGRRVGVEPRCMRVLELNLLEASAPQAEVLSGEEILISLRVHKDASEIASMRAAVDIAQRALQATLPSIKAGVSELQLASELTLQLLRHEVNVAEQQSDGTPAASAPSMNSREISMLPRRLCTTPSASMVKGLTSSRAWTSSELKPRLYHTMGWPSSR